MRHHARQFGLLVRVQNQAAVDVEKSARQRKRIHHVRIDNLNCKRNLGVGIAHQVLTHAVHVLIHHRVVDEFRLLLDLGRKLLAQRNLMFQRIEIQPVPHVTISNRVDVGLGTGLHIGIVRWLPGRRWLVRLLHVAIARTRLLLVARRGCGSGLLLALLGRRWTVAAWWTAHSPR